LLFSESSFLDQTFDLSKKNSSTVIIIPVLVGGDYKNGILRCFCKFNPSFAVNQIIEKLKSSSYEKVLTAGDISIFFIRVNSNDKGVLNFDNLKVELKEIFKKDEVRKAKFLEVVQVGGQRWPVLLAFIRNLALVNSKAILTFHK